MGLLELGILQGRKPLVSKRSDETFETKVHSELRLGLLSCINDFIGEAFSEQIDSFSMKNHIIYLLPYRMEQLHQVDETTEDNLIFYCIGDKKLKKKPAHKILRKTLDGFLEKYEHLRDFSGDSAAFGDFDVELGKFFK